MTAIRCFLLLLLLFGALPVPAQYSVSLRHTHERILCVVPMVGSGKPGDPRRPMYVPVPERGRDPRDSREGIIAFVAQVSDDGNFALVELVAYDRAAFRQIYEDKHPQVKVFEKGKAKRADIEKEFRKHKRDFDFERFGVGVL